MEVHCMRRHRSTSVKEAVTSESKANERVKFKQFPAVQSQRLLKRRAV